jgi:hypothetical protein
MTHQEIVDLIAQLRALGVKRFKSDAFEVVLGGPAPVVLPADDPADKDLEARKAAWRGYTDEDLGLS